MWAFVTIKDAQKIQSPQQADGSEDDRSIADNKSVNSPNGGQGAASSRDGKRRRKSPTGSLAEHFSKSADFNSWGSPVVLRAEVPLVTVQGRLSVRRMLLICI